MFITLAFGILSVAVALGAGLALHYLRGPAVRSLPWPIRVGHGALGAAGLAVLLAALHRGLPPSETGTTGFGPAAAVLFGLALVLGLARALPIWGQRSPGILVAFHAGLAITGFVVLWTLVSFI